MNYAETVASFHSALRLVWFKSFADTCHCSQLFAGQVGAAGSSSSVERIDL